MMLAAAGGAQTPRESPSAEASSADVAAALRLQLTQAGSAADPEIAAFYRSRDYEPIWTPGGLRPEALWLVKRLWDEDADNAGLAESARAAKDADPWKRAQLELQLSAAYADRVGGRFRGGPGEPFAFVDPQLATAFQRAKALQAAASARNLQEHLQDSLGAQNPIRAALERTLKDYRATWGKLPKITVPEGAELKPGASGARLAALRARLGLSPRRTYDLELAERVTAFQLAHGLSTTGTANAETIQALNRGPDYYQRLIEANLDRARALPAALGDSYILVDAAAGQLWYVDGGQVRTTMKVVVGKPSQPTPMMAGLVRYLMFNPYWNVPEDLVRTSIAPKVLARGLAYVQQENLEVLSDYSDAAVPLDAAKVDWRAVARGDLTVRVRQRPGPKNMMGQVKLMLPNPLGIYLHDTPLRGDFARSLRLASSGCVRLEHAMSLAKLLVGARQTELAADGSREEHRVDLKTPVPVYITYFTVSSTAKGLVVRPDVYGRDRPRDETEASNQPDIIRARATGPVEFPSALTSGRQLSLLSAF